MGRSLTKLADVKHENDHVAYSHAVDQWLDHMHEYKHVLKSLNLGMRMMMEVDRRNRTMKKRQIVSIWSRRAQRAMRKERIREQKQKLRESHFMMAVKRLYKHMTHEFNLRLSNALRQWEKNIDMGQLEAAHRCATRHPPPLPS